MKHLTILIPNGENNNLSSIVGAYKIFSRANEKWIQGGRNAIFDIQLAGVSREVQFHAGIFSVRPHTTIAEIEKTDLIIIPSLNHDYKKAIALNTALADWTAEQYINGAEVASICTGAFLLAATGILHGKNCSTHWSAADDFRLMFPEIHLQPDKLITDENGIYTNGGAYSFLNLMIYLIEKYYDRQTALFCAKIFQIEIDRNTQSEFTIFSGQKHHDDELILQAQNYIEKNLDEKISIEELSTKFNIGRRNFDRRFIKATGNTPLEYSQRVKIELAKKTLENTRKTINEVMYEVGYADVKAFREVFRKYTGMTAVEYRGKYGKNGARVGL